MEKITLTYNGETYEFNPKVVEGQPLYGIYINDEVQAKWHLQIGEGDFNLYYLDRIQGSYLSSTTLSYEVIVEIVGVIRNKIGIEYSLN